MLRFAVHLHVTLARLLQLESHYCCPLLPLQHHLLQPAASALVQGGCIKAPVLSAETARFALHGLQQHQTVLALQRITYILKAKHKDRCAHYYWLFICDIYRDKQSNSTDLYRDKVCTATRCTPQGNSSWTDAGQHTRAARALYSARPKHSIRPAKA